jgi:hypothetical protein
MSEALMAGCTGPAAGTNLHRDTRSVVEEHWQLANSRHWAAFAALLHPALCYEVPQTREYIESGVGYLEMFQTWPGNWTAKVKHLACDERKAICVIDFVVGADAMTGITVFEVAGGLIERVTDYWPEAYEPPVRYTSHMKRRPAGARAR